MEIRLCALPNDGAQRRACIHAVADINRAVLGNILRLDAVRQTVRDLDRHRAALDGRGDQFIHLVFGGRWHRPAARLCNVEHLADIIPRSLSAVILVHLPHNGRVTFLAGTDMPSGILPLLECAGVRDVGVLAGEQKLVRQRVAALRHEVEKFLQGRGICQYLTHAGIHLRPNRFTLGFLHGSVFFLRILRF